MKTINLRWMYPHYRHDEFVDVTDEVWEAIRQAQREVNNYERRTVYHRAYYSLDAYSWLENYALEHSRSPEDILLEREEMATRLRLIAALPVALAHATPTQQHVKASRYGLPYLLICCTCVGCVIRCFLSVTTAETRIGLCSYLRYTAFNFGTSDFFTACVNRIHFTCFKFIR